MAFVPAAPLPLPSRHLGCAAKSSQTPTMIRAPPTRPRTTAPPAPPASARVVAPPIAPPLSAPTPAPDAFPTPPDAFPTEPPVPSVFPIDKPRRRTKAAAMAARTASAAVDHLIRDQREYYYHDLDSAGGSPSRVPSRSRVASPRPRAAPGAPRTQPVVAPQVPPARQYTPVDAPGEGVVVGQRPTKAPTKTRRKTGSGGSGGRRLAANDDSIRSYLHEIGEVKLLDAESEVNLAREIAKLLELERVSARLKEATGVEPPIAEWAVASGMDIEAFRDTLRRGLRAKEHMVAANLRLVVSIAKKYLNRGLSFQDLIQEGSIGLIRGAEKFDGNKGFKFSTYATWWIRQAITRAIADHSRPIRLPVHVNDTIAAIKKITKHLSNDYGRLPTEVEIAEHMQITVEKLRFLARSARATISLETPIGRDGRESNATLGSFIVWDGDTPEESTMKALLREDLENVLNTLSARERDVVRMRYGFDDGKMKTLEEIGTIFAVTRERIRQIEAKALRKLRHPNRNAVLREYVYEEQ